MTNILFLAFEFPPLNRGGVHRSLAFVKYLPQFGVNPIVVSLDPESYPDVFDQYGLDESLGKELEASATLIRLKSEPVKAISRMGRFLSIYFSLHGNEVKNWKKNYFSALPQIMTTYSPKLVFATLPPFSMLPVALKTARLYGLPMVLDFRDAWSQWRTLPFGTWFHYQVNLDLEKKYLDKAAAIITTSLQTLEDFKQLHPHIATSKFHYIPNGYDGELDGWKTPELDTNPIRIGYVGSFYYSPEARKQMLAPWWKKRGHRMLQYMPRKQDWLYRSPYFFFKALKHLQLIRPAVFKRIKVEFVGKKPDWLTDMIREMGLDEQVSLLGEKTHKDALWFQKGCDLLLITSAKMIGGRDYSIAGKTFEYIQAQKPILSFASEGAQKDILKKTGLALICDPDNEQQSAEKILSLISGELVLTPDFQFIGSLSRKALSGQLAQLLNQVGSA